MTEDEAEGSGDDEVTGRRGIPDGAEEIQGVPETSRLADLLDDIEDGEYQALHQTVATYESAIASAHDAAANDASRDLHHAYGRRLITGLDEATQAEGWSFLNEFLDAYHPDTSDELPRITRVLENVVGRSMIRTRIATGVESIPVVALEYFDAVRDEMGEYQDLIREGLHPYGWGIGHPDHPVADRIHDHATEEIFLVNPFLEHAFYADQYAAIDLLERIVEDDSIQHSVSYPTGEITETRYLLDAAAGVASDDFWPTIPRYWDWHEDLDGEFDLDDEVAQRVRDIVVEHGLDDDLPSDWQITDLTI